MRLFLGSRVGWFADSKIFSKEYLSSVLELETNIRHSSRRLSVSEAVFVPEPMPGSEPTSCRVCVRTVSVSESVSEPDETHLIELDSKNLFSQFMIFQIKNTLKVNLGLGGAFPIQRESKL